MRAKIKPMVVFRFLFLCSIKILGRIFYSFDFEWIEAPVRHPFREARLNLYLNHTSLIEPIVLAVLPFSYIWQLANRATFPAADITMKRSIAGTLYKALAPNPISISRRRDHSWKKFLETVAGKAIVWMTPEGRMKRLNGLDKAGKPMTVRPGVVEVLERLKGGSLVLIHSGGLHHVLPPGQGFPNLFKIIRFRFEVLRVDEYKIALGHGTDAFRDNVIADLESRRDRHMQWDEAPASLEPVIL